MLAIEFINKNEISDTIKVDHKLLTSPHDINTHSGFYKNYINILPYFKNRISAFMYVNVLHFAKYNTFKYKSFKEFRKKIFE